MLKARVSEDNRLEGKHREQYEKLVARITDLITRAKAQGYDTATLESQLTVLQGLIETFKTDKDAYIAALKASQTAVCGKTEGEFKDSTHPAKAVKQRSVQGQVNPNTLLEWAMKTRPGETVVTYEYDRFVRP